MCRVSVSQLFSYIMRKGKTLASCISGLVRMQVLVLNVSANSGCIVIVWLQQTRIGLSLFDIQGLGYLKESVSVCTYLYTQLVST